LNKYTPRKSVAHSDRLEVPVNCKQGQVKIDLVIDEKSGQATMHFSVMGFTLWKTEDIDQQDVLRRAFDSYAGFTATASSETGVSGEVDKELAGDMPRLILQLKSFRHTAVSKLDSMHLQKIGKYVRRQAPNSPYMKQPSTEEDYNPRALTAAAMKELGLSS